MAKTPFLHSIAAKILGAVLVVGMVSVGLTGWQSYQTARAALEQSSFDRLTAVRETKKRQVEACFALMRDQIRTLAEAPETGAVLQEMSTGFHAALPQPEATDPVLRHFYETEFLPRLQANLVQPAGLDPSWPADPLSRHWQGRYVAGNPYAVGSKDNLIQQTDNTAYDLAHAKAHRVFRPFLHRFGFYDIFLVDARSGHIVYTVFKETDYATSLLDGPYASTNIGRLFRDALQSADRQFCQLADYEAYRPSYSAPAAFIGAPVFDGEDKIGVLLAQVPVNEINRVMTGDQHWAQEGLGETGETYLLGPDFQMRTDSRFLLEDTDGFAKVLQGLNRPADEVDRIRRLKTTILNLEVRTEAAMDALGGTRQTRIIRDYRHEPVLSSWTPLDIPDVKWVLLAEMDASEAFAPIATLRSRLLWTSAGLLLPVLGLGWLLSSSFAANARRLLQGIQRVRSGAPNESITISSHDELGAVVDAFNDMARELQSTTVSKDYVDSVINSMNDALLVAACVPGTKPDDTGAELLISDANPYALRLMGRSLAELRGLPLREFLRPGADPAASDDYWTLGGVSVLRDRAASQPIEGHLYPRDRDPVPVTISLSLQHESDGLLRRAVVVAHDYTEQKQAREALAHANTMKDSFLANTSHELRTPLNGIIGIAESLIEGAAGPLTASQRQNVEMMGTSARRLAHLVNDILDFSKLRHRALDLQRNAVDVRVVADIVIALARTLIALKPIEVLNHIPVDAPLVHADGNRLQQILHNLIGNAIKFTAEGRVQLTAEVVGSQLAISVIDTGIGIPADQFGRIFESFEQADGSTEREYGGTGLGLAITRQLVELHGGEITVTSSVGRGSRFTFTVPVSAEVRSAESTAQATQLAERLSRVYANEDEEAGVSPLTPDAGPVSEETEAELARNRRVHLLAVDDEPVNLQVLRNYLGLHQYNITLATSGHEALELLRSNNRFDLVILDVMMPRMSGYECCRKIRELHSLNALPVLMLTAKNQVDDLVAGFDAGANDYLAKPFSRHELLSRVRTHVHLGRIHSAYGRFVPHEFLGFLNKESLVDVQAGDQVQKLMTVLFADIRGFTSLSEKMTLQENFTFINEFLGQMEPCIRTHHGFIDKFIGDAIMALFGAIGDDAVQAALTMLQRLDTLNAEHAASSSRTEPVRIGIGLHTGSLILGTVGGEKRLDSTVISDAVNLASRVESLTKTYDVSLLLTGETHASLRNPDKFNLRVIDRVRVSGKSQTTELYEVFDADPPERRAQKRKTLAHFDRGFVLYRRRQFREAAAKFEAALAVLPDDQPAQILLDRCRRLAGTNVPDNWDASIPASGVIKTVK